MNAFTMFVYAVLVVLIGVGFYVMVNAFGQPTEYVDPSEPIPEVDVCGDILADCEDTTFDASDDCDHG